MGAGDRRTVATAAEVRERNAELDAALLEVAAGFEAGLLTAGPDDGGWSAAQVMAHLGEFPRFFGGELRRWYGARDAIIGRTHEHPVRQAAVAPGGPPSAGLDTLLADMRAAFAALAAALEPLQDADLHAPTNNVRYGVEPLTAFLDRYVLGHKEGHLAQLRALAGG